MLNHRFSLAKTLLGGVVALALTAAPALAASRGHAPSHYSGSRGNFAGNRGSYSGYRGSYGRYSGYRGSYGDRDGYRGSYGYRGYRGGYYGGYVPSYLGLGLGLGLGAYNYGYNSYPYDYGTSYDYSPNYYVTPPATNIIVTPDVGASTSAYYSPAYSPMPAPADDVAHIQVLTPAPDAQVFFDGAQTRQQGTDREFVSPPLTPGQTYHYTVEARWMQDGRMVGQSRIVTVTAGQDATVDFGR